MNKSANPPIVLSFSALDPSGGGGIQADIETAASLGVHCAPIVSSLCSEALTQTSITSPIDSSLLIEQARSVIDVLNIAAINVGYLGSVANIEAVHSILADFPNIPTITQPGLYLWDKDDAEQDELPDAYAALILPESSVSCLSLFEARQVVEQIDTIDASAQAIMSLGCESVLITGTGKDHLQFQNSFYDASGVVHTDWIQEAPTSHGASSTLAMSTASYMAHGFNIKQAVQQALFFTLQAMRASRDMGLPERIPHRLFWADKNIDITDSSSSKTSH